jgi:hypothetical protein
VVGITAFDSSLPDASTPESCKLVFSEQLLFLELQELALLYRG